MDDWSSVDDRVGQMVGGVVGNCMVGNWVGNSVMGNRVGHCMVGNWMGNSMVSNWMGHCVVGNRVGNGTGDRVSQEANAMVSWRMVDSMSWVGHGMVGSMVHCRSSMMHNRSSVVDHWGSMMHKWCSMVHKWCSMMHNRGSMVYHRGSMVNNRGGMVHNWSSISRSLIIDCLSSVSHFLDHPISTIVVSHRLHSSIGQGDGVRAGGGVAISGLLLLEVCSAVAVVDPVLVGVRRGLGQVLVGQLRSWGSQATADKGQQQDHLGGEEVGGASGKRWEGNNIMVKGQRKWGNYFKGKGLRIGWIMRCLVGVADFLQSPRICVVGHLHRGTTHRHGLAPAPRAALLYTRLRF